MELGIKEYENFDKNPYFGSLDNVDIAINKYKNHPSLKMINENISFESRFNFKVSQIYKKKFLISTQRRWESLVKYLLKYLQSLQMFVMHYLEIFGILKY